MLRHTGGKCRIVQQLLHDLLDVHSPPQELPAMGSCLSVISTSVPGKARKRAVESEVR